MSQMQGTITRDVVADVMNEIPELLVSPLTGVPHQTYFHRVLNLVKVSKHRL